MSVNHTLPSIRHGYRCTLHVNVTRIIIFHRKLHQKEQKALQKKCESIVAAVIYTATKPESEMDSEAEYTIVEEIIDPKTHTSNVLEATDPEDIAVVTEKVAADAALPTSAGDVTTQTGDIAVQTETDEMSVKIVVDNAAVQTDEEVAAAQMVMNDTAVQCELVTDDIAVQTQEAESSEIQTDVIHVVDEITMTEAEIKDIKLSADSVMQTEQVSVVTVDTQTDVVTSETADVQTDEVKVQTARIQTEPAESEHGDTQNDVASKIPAIEKYKIIAEAKQELRKDCIKDFIDASRELGKCKEALEKLQNLNMELKADIAHFEDRLAFRE